MTDNPLVLCSTYGYTVCKCFSLTLQAGLSNT